MVEVYFDAKNLVKGASPAVYLQSVAGDGQKVSLNPLRFWDGVIFRVKSPILG